MQKIQKIYNPWLIAIVVSLAAFMEVLDTTITNVSLSHIAGTLGASQDESTWIITSYLVANGIILPLSGWLADIFGRKRFFMLCIALFTLASFACGLATSLPMLIFFRILQGLAGGGLQPIQQAIVLDAFPPEKRGAAFGVTGITMVVAPILGPTLGGYITDNYSWQWIFLMNIPVGIFALIMVAKMVVDPEHAKAKIGRSIDFIGLGLVAIGLGSLQIMLDKGQQEDWFASNFIIFFACVSFTCLACAIFWLLKQKDPIIDLRIFGDRAFAMSWFMMFCIGASLYGGSTLLPILVQSEFGYDATLAGLVLSPGGIAVIFLMPIAGKLVGKVAARYLAALGMGLTAIGMWVTANMTPQTDFGTFVMMRNLQVLGLPFLFIPISTLAFLHIPKEKSSMASAIFAMSRNLGGSVGIAVMASYIVRQGQVHQAYLSEHINAGSIAYKQTIGEQSLHHIYSQMLHQANIMAFSDAFMVNAFMMAALVIFALLMPYNQPHAKKPGDAPTVH